MPGPETSLWVNLNRDEFRSFGNTGQVNRVPGTMLAGPASRACVIEFEEGRAHVSATFVLGSASCFVAPPLALARDGLVPLENLWGRSGACLRERLLEAKTPGDAVPCPRNCVKRFRGNAAGARVCRPRMNGPLSR